MESNSESLGTVIRSGRGRQQITLREFAKRMGISASLLSLIEQDRHVPPPELIERMARELNQNPDVWCGIAGKLTPSAEESLARMARTRPKFFREMIKREKGSS